MDFIYYIFKDFVHYSALVLLAAIIPAAIVGFIKPSLFSGRFKMFSSRKTTAIGSFASVVLFTGMVLVTGPTSMEQQQLDQESADKQRQTETQKENDFAATKQTTIEKKLLQETQPIPYEKQEKTDNRLPAGQKKITQNGINGKRTLTYELTYENGNEVSRELKTKAVTKKPVAQVMLVGTSKAAAAQKSSGSKPKASASQPKHSCESLLKLFLSGSYSKACLRLGN